MIAFVLPLAWGGFSALSLAMDRHGRRVFRAPLARGTRRLLRLTGWILLAASLLPCLLALPWGLALVAWLLVLTPVALCVAFGLTYAACTTVFGGPAVTLLAAIARLLIAP